MSRSALTLLLSAPLTLSALCADATTQTIAAPFNTRYTIQSLGTVSGLPTPYGGLTFKAGDPNYVLIGGAANVAAGAIYQVRVTRDATNHVTGFGGGATRYCDGPNNDGGVGYGPNNVLFLTRYPTNQLAQVKSTHTATDRLIDLTPLGVASSVGACALVPAGFPGAGRLKLCSYNTSRFYDATLTADANGTFDVSAATLTATLTGTPEGIAYIPPGSPLFADYSHGSWLTSRLADRLPLAIGGRAQ